VTTPAEDEPYGWYCVESGKPGKWKAMPLAKMLGELTPLESFFLTG